MRAEVDEDGRAVAFLEAPCLHGDAALYPVGVGLERLGCGATYSIV